MYIVICNQSGTVGKIDSRTMEKLASGGDAADMQVNYVWKGRKECWDDG